MSKSTPAEDALARWLFHKTVPAFNANTHLYVSLHREDPGEAGAQNTNEVAYGGYARVAVVRTSSGFTIADTLVSNAAEILFPTCTSGAVTATHAAIGTAATGAGLVLHYGPLSSSLPISTGQTPRFGIGSLTISDQ